MKQNQPLKRNCLCLIVFQRKILRTIYNPLCNREMKHKDKDIKGITMNYKNFMKIKRPSLLET